MKYKILVLLCIIFFFLLTLEGCYEKQEETRCFYNYVFDRSQNISIICGTDSQYMQFTIVKIRVTNTASFPIQTEPSSWALIQNTANEMNKEVIYNASEASYCGFVSNQMIDIDPGENHQFEIVYDINLSIPLSTLQLVYLPNRTLMQIDTSLFIT